jgi:hypothetical protein
MKGELKEDKLKNIIDKVFPNHNLHPAYFKNVIFENRN